MKKLWGVPVLAAAIWAGTVSSAAALPFSPFNTRPVTVNAPYPGELSLQQELNSIFQPLAGIYGVPDALTGQSSNGMWGLAASPGGIVPALAFEQTAAAGFNSYGIWSWNEATSMIERVQIFLGGASPSTPISAQAFLTWTDPTTVVVGGFGCGVWVACTTGVPVTHYADSSAFGFYLQNGNNIYYSVDSLNDGGAARALAYQQGPTTNWAIAFEDGGDGDFNDGVLKVESIQPVPEPATLLLLGSGLVGIVSKGRARMRRA